MKSDFQKTVEKICAKDPRYHRDAYVFVMESLGFTQQQIEAHRHVTGAELLSGIRDYAIEQFGPMAMTVLGHWGIHSTEDLGSIVFNMVDQRLLSKTEDDTIEHFKNGYDFKEVFLEGYRKSLHKKIRKMEKI